MPSFVAALNRNPSSSAAICSNGGSGVGGSEFTIQQEDFPALPGSQSLSSAAAAAASMELALASSGGRMVRDQYGMLGLLSFIKLCEENREDIRYIGRGVDPNSVGLPMMQQSDIHPLMASPWPELCVAMPQYTDHPVPQEYLVGPQIRERLPAPPLDALPVETLFWLFYACACDRWQLCAAKELHRRHWRWVKADRLWVTRSGDRHERLPGAEGERGRYLYWDTEAWSVQVKQLTIRYDQIDDSPNSFPDPGPGAGVIGTAAAAAAGLVIANGGASSISAIGSINGFGHAAST